MTKEQVENKTHYLTVSKGGATLQHVSIDQMKICLQRI